MLVGALCGLVGVHVVLRRLSFFTMAMTHATFPGVVLAALVGVDLLLGSGAVRRARRARRGLAVARGRAATRPPRSGWCSSAGFALGVALLSAQAGFTRDLSGYLVGSILTVQTGDLVKTALVLAAVARHARAGAARSWCSARSTAAGWSPPATRPAGSTCSCCCWSS